MGTTDIFIYVILKATLIDLIITPMLQMGKWRFRKIKQTKTKTLAPDYYKSKSLKYKAKVLNTNLGLGRFKSPFSFHSHGYLASYLAVLNGSFFYSFPSGWRPMPPRETSSFLPNTGFASG